MEEHRCRVCSKCFSSGRSLGGHMRAHMYVYITEAQRKKLSGGFTAGYALMESQKGIGKQCKECGKEFLSSKALFGHMRCHSEKIGRQGSLAGEERERFLEQNQEEGEEGSWSSQRFYMDSISGDNAFPAESGWNCRTIQDTTAIRGTAEAASSSITEHEREQEDVAISLMMLSRDFRGCWAPSTESSDKHSLVLESGKLIQQSESGDFGCVQSEDAEDSGDAPRKQKTLKLGEFGVKRARKDKKGNFLNAYESKLGRTKPNLESRHQCASCNKIFQSYQALGGHRASHKRIKSCCSQKPYSSIDGTDDNDDHLTLENRVSHSNLSNNIILHQCSICGKTFSSGQALGGHKRSHIPPSTRSSQNAIKVVAAVADVKVPELLDLNFPAPVDEESSNVKPWSTSESISHEQQHLIDFISN